MNTKLFLKENALFISLLFYQDIISHTIALIVPALVKSVSMKKAWKQESGV